jgi:transposase
VLSRHDISDAQWNLICHLLPGQPGQHGGIAEDNRRFINAIRYISRTGIAWADLPTCFGKWNSVWKRYNHWCKTGVWEKIAGALRNDDTTWISIDSTVVRANVSAAGAKKKSMGAEVRRGRRWGGAAADSPRNCMAS